VTAGLYCCVGCSAGASGTECLSGDDCCSGSCPLGSCS
jgi:hypothetical protein